MTQNPIIQEIREIRHQLAAQQGNDVHRIGEELRRRQMESGRRVVRLPKREPEIPSSNHRMHGIGGEVVTANPESTPSAGRSVSTTDSPPVQPIREAVADSEGIR
jgi:hypothetical protein